MRWILYIGGALLAVVAIVGLIGAMLPRNHVASRRAHFRNSPEEVFTLISGPQNWRPGVEKWEQVDDTRFVEVTGGGGRMLMQIVESKPPLRRVTRIADDNLPFGGTWTWEITPDSEGCTARITENGFVTNVIFRFVSHLIIGHHSTMETYLKDLGTRLGDLNIKIEE